MFQFASRDNRTAQSQNQVTASPNYFFRPATQNSFFIQKQPAPQTPAKPNLSSVSATDPASQKTHPTLINAALLASSKYGKYLSSKLSGAGAIDAKNKFIIELSIQNFVNNYNKCYGTNVTTLSGTEGFYCSSSKEIHLIPNADFGMAFHESVHKSSALASVIQQTNWTNEAQFAFDLNEGLTSHYTKEILEKDYNINNYIDGYASQRKKAGALIKSLGESEVAAFYFKYNLSGILPKLGIHLPFKGDVNLPMISKLKSMW
ncbi:MAG: hypothetical protein ABJB05_15200 [Parafilimonas sp.]